MCLSRRERAFFFFIADGRVVSGRIQWGCYSAHAEEEEAAVAVVAVRMAMVHSRC